MLTRRLEALHSRYFILKRESLYFIGVFSEKIIERLMDMKQVKNIHFVKEETIAGKVVHGRKQGRRLGFPTANIDADTVQENGVYGVLVYLKGNQYRGIMNSGLKPTYGSDLTKTVEVHLLDFNGDIYGEYMECQPLFRVREERKFPSLEFLIQQIKEDIYYANEKFNLLGESFKRKRGEFLRTEQIS